MKKIVFLFIAFLFINTLISQEKVLIRIENPTKTDINEFYKNSYDIAAYKPGSFLDLVVSYKEFENLVNKGYQATIYKTEQQLKENLVMGKELDGYRNYNDLLTELQQIETNYPGICKLYDIGDTRGKEYSNGGNSNYDNYNHESWALKVSDNVEIEEDEPAIYYFGVHHAREPISLEVAMYILDHILTNYGTDPDITYDVNNKQIWFVPLVNPNGHKIVTDELDVWCRKNIADNDGDGQIDLYHADGVDPNRNYGWEWGGGGSSGDPGNEVYRGPTPFSEPETQAIRDLMFNHHFIAGITYHSHGELVLYPNGYSSGATARDHDALEDLAVNMATNIPGLSGGNYTPEEGWQLYPADGVTDDYAYGQHGIFSFTVELGQVFIPPAGDILTICQDNLQAAMILLDRVDQNTLTGLVKDANTLLPVEAEIFIDGIDNTGVYKEPYLSDSDFGRYYRFILDGDYDVTFSAYGYIPQTFNSVNINNLSQTVLDVFLVPAQTIDISGTVTDFDTGLPIENATIEILGTPLSPATTNQDGEYTFDNVMEGTYTFRVYALDYSTIMQENTISTSNTVFDFQLQESFAWSFETGAFEPQWSFGGNAPWIVTTENPYDGAYCAKSGSIGDQSTSEMEITLNLMTGGDVSFARKVSSEASYDYLEFYIDDVKQDEWAGEVAWAEVFYPVTSGQHTFKWIYDKDQSVANGSDCGWVDYIIFPPLSGPADIDLSALSFEVSVPPGGNATEVLTIYNVGEADLQFSLSKYYDPTKNNKAYCTSVGGGGDEFIGNVTIGTINNSTAQSNYADYTAMSTVVNVGESYPITITNGDPIWTSDQCGIWVDWNQNEDFSDDTPISVSGTPGVGPYTATITPPVDALPGLARMRVQIIYSATPDPCLASFSYGEVEDYSLNVNSNFVDWLSFNPVEGTISEDNSAIIDVEFDAAELEEGDYYADLIITSTDPDESQINLPCTLHVGDMAGFDVNLTVLLEGPYYNGSMGTDLIAIAGFPLSQPFNVAPWNYFGVEAVGSVPNSNIVDWALVELRDASAAAGATEATVLASQAGFLLYDGSVVDIDGSSPMFFDQSVAHGLYAVVYTRNHIAIMSASQLDGGGGMYSYDFSIGSGQVYGGSLGYSSLGDGNWGMSSGDGNSDGEVNLLDENPEWEMQAGEAGYLLNDYNWDGQVDNTDKDEFWLPNLGKGTGVPE